MVEQAMIAAGDPDAGRAGREDHDEPAQDGGEERDGGSEVVVHAVLRLACDHPGMLGRLRSARVVGGYAVPERDGGPTATDLARYAVRVDLHLKEIVALVDAMLEGGLLAQTPGVRPTLVLTRSGFRALEAMERP